MGIVNINETLFVSMTNISQTANITLYNVCISAPPHILSDGIWGGHTTERGPLKSSFPVFLLQIILIYGTTRTLHFPMKMLGFPVLISQMMVSI